MMTPTRGVPIGKKLKKKPITVQKKIVSVTVTDSQSVTFSHLVTLGQWDNSISDFSELNFSYFSIIQRKACTHVICHVCNQ
jgi:hypothetical protein